MDLNLITALRLPEQSYGKSSASYPKRKANITWVEHLDRNSLEYTTAERAILLHTTTIGEKIFIQYPGKESSPVTKTGRKRDADAIRPWDFRPKVVPMDGVVGRDLSFGHIWSVILENSEKLAQANNPDALKVLAMLFYRMAFMADHVVSDIPNIMHSKVEDSLIHKQELLPHPYPFFLYSPPSIAVNSIPALDWCGMSLEAFLFYNDFLAWNEDCKYYYRDTIIKKKTTWLNGTGRMNTLLTHLRFLGCCLDLVPLAVVFEDFSRGKGVSPASADDVKMMCPEFIGS